MIVELDRTCHAHHYYGRPLSVSGRPCYILPMFFYPPFASIAKGEVSLLFCFTVCLFVCSSTISRQPAGRFTPKFACRRTLVPDVSSPLLGVGGPWRAEKGANEIFVTMGVNGEFLHFGGFRAISQQRVHGSTPNIICVRTMSADVPPPPVGFTGP